MLKIEKILGLDEYTHEADTFRVDYAGCLDIYIPKSTIGLTRARNTLIFRKAKEWREWDEKFVSNTKKRVARLVKIFGRDSLDEIFGSQVTIAMLIPLRFHRLHRERLKKTSVRDRRSDNSSGLKYGIRVPRKAKQAIQFDQENGNKL